MFKIRLTGGKLTAEDWRRAIIAGILSLGLFASVDAQNSDPWANKMVRRDTIVPQKCTVTQYTNRNGKLDYKAIWCEKSIPISDKDGAAIINGDDPAIVLIHYNVEGHNVIRAQKVIAVNLRKNGNTK